MSNVVCLQQAHSWVETEKEIIDYLLCDKISTIHSMALEHRGRVRFLIKQGE